MSKFQILYSQEIFFSVSVFDEYLNIQSAVAKVIREFKKITSVQTMGTVYMSQIIIDNEIYYRVGERFINNNDQEIKISNKV